MYSAFKWSTCKPGSIVGDRAILPDGDRQGDCANSSAKGGGYEFRLNLGLDKGQYVPRFGDGAIFIIGNSDSGQASFWSLLFGSGVARQRRADILAFRLEEIRDSRILVMTHSLGTSIPKSSPAPSLSSGKPQKKAVQQSSSGKMAASAAAAAVAASAASLDPRNGTIGRAWNAATTTLRHICASAMRMETPSTNLSIGRDMHHRAHVWRQETEAMLSSISDELLTLSEADLLPLLQAIFCANAHSTQS
eukprot:2806980-Pleurochrysis_carterae.AAC.2